MPDDVTKFYQCVTEITMKEEFRDGCCRTRSLEDGY